MQGTGAELCAELSLVVRALYEDVSTDTDEEFAKYVIEKAVRLGMKKQEELEKEMKESMANLMKKIAESLESEEKENE